MKKELLIHIGYPKCLSTWMQKILFIESNGYLTVLDPLLSKILIIDPPPFRYKVTKVQEYIRKDLETHPHLTPVISAENLAGNILAGGYDAQINAERLKLAFPNAKILIVIREQLSLIRSVYKTQVNWGSPYPISHLLQKNKLSLIPEFSLEHYKYDGIIEHYQMCFGKNNVLILPYELFIEKPTEFIASIASLTDNDINLSKLNIKRKINGNSPIANIHYARIKNRLLRSSFNFNGLINDNENRLNKRIKKSKLKSVFPQSINNWLEKKFHQQLENTLKHEFSESNLRTQELTGLNLEKYNYQIK